VEDIQDLADRFFLSPCRLVRGDKVVSPVLPPGACRVATDDSGRIQVEIPRLRATLSLTGCSAENQDKWLLACIDGIIVVEFLSDVDFCPPGQMSMGRKRRFYDANLRMLLQKNLSSFCRLESLSSGRDPFMRYSGKFCRLIVRMPSGFTAGMAMYPFQQAEEGAAFLSAAILWFHYCRQRKRRFTRRMILLFPSDMFLRVVGIVQLLNSKLIQPMILSYNLDTAFLAHVDPDDAHHRFSRHVSFEFLPPRPLHQNPSAGKLLEQYHPHLRHEKTPYRFDLITFRGLPLVHIFGPSPKDLFLGWGNPLRCWTDFGHRQRNEWIEMILKTRTDPSPAPFHQAYRLFPERWLESLIIQNIQHINSDFQRNWTYRQVPAYRGTGRAIMDVLTLSKGNRAAVLEIKAGESETLLFQSLDYWERVREGVRTGAFHRSGYFAGMILSRQWPHLYLITPLFRFHKNIFILRKYLLGEIPIHLVEVNLRWRKKLQLVRRSRLL